MVGERCAPAVCPIEPKPLTARSRAISTVSADRRLCGLARAWVCSFSWIPKQPEKHERYEWHAPRYRQPKVK
jgi:hypothetical protein